MKYIKFFLFSWIFLSLGPAFTAGTKAPFLSIWKTTSLNEAVMLPLVSKYKYNFSVDWGDGSGLDLITSFDDKDRKHTYSVPGEYLITITGLVEALNSVSTVNFYNKDKLIEVVDLGDVGWKNLDGAFSGCSNLVSFSGGNTSAVTNMRTMFSMAINLKTVDLSSFNTELVTSMNSMFYGTPLVSLDLSHFNTSAVKNMSNMFGDTKKLISLNLLGWDTSSLIHYKYILDKTNPNLSIKCSQADGNFFGKKCSNFSNKIKSNKPERDEGFII